VSRRPKPRTDLTLGYLATLGGVGLVLWLMVLLPMWYWCGR